MSTLRISDAPLLPDVDGTEKIPTGGRGDYAISVDQIKDHIFQDIGKELVGLGNVDNTSDLDKPVSTAQQAALNLKADKTYVDAGLDLKADKTNVYTRSETTLALSNKADLVSGVIPSNQLPSYVDDVVEYTTSTLPIVGESGKIYVTTDNNRTWRWSGNQYVEISNGGISDSTLKLQTPRKIANVEFDGTQDIEIPHNNLTSRNVENAHTASSIGTASGENQQDINDYTGAKWRNKAGGYDLNARVMLDNGDIVKSNVANNTVNPNVDMTGWVLTSTYIVDSIADMLAIENPKDESLCQVKSFYSPDNLALAQPFKGGDDFVFNSTKSLINDNISVFNGWQRISNNLDTHKAGLKGDGVTDDLAAIRNYVMFLANSGGGTVVFSESDLGYKFSDAIYVVSDVSFDINSQKLIGTSGKSLFKTAKITSGTYVPITSFDPNNVIINSQISNATIESSSIVFDLRSFTLLCSVKNIQFQHCTQGFILHDCFYSRWENLQATPTSGSITLPFYHLAAANNAMVFDRVSATVEWGWLIEGGSTALQFNVCTFEGGSKGYVIKGDVLGCSFNAGYYEAVTGTLFDLSQAGDCRLSFESNYINGVDIVFQDGGAGTLFGNWESSNSIVNIGGDLGTGFTFRGLMNVSSARNYIKFNLTVITSDNLSTPTNWNLSKGSDFNRAARWNADGATDIRATADVHGGVIPVKYSGDFGNPFPDNIHFCTKSALATGSSVSLNIDTQLTYQPLSLFVKVVLQFRREVGGVYQYYYAYGDIYGSIFELKGGLDVNASKQVTATVVNNAGNLRIVLNNIANPNGDLIVTGTVRAIS